MASLLRCADASLLRLKVTSGSGGCVKAVALVGAGDPGAAGLILQAAGDAAEGGVSSTKVAGVGGVG